MRIRNLATFQSLSKTLCGAPVRPQHPIPALERAAACTEVSHHMIQAEGAVHPCHKVLDCCLVSVFGLLLSECLNNQDEKRVAAHK